MIEQRPQQCRADTLAAMFRPDDDVGYACEHGAVARSAGKADLPPVDQRDGADRILEGAPVDLVRALAAPVACLQKIRGRLEVEA